MPEKVEAEKVETETKPKAKETKVKDSKAKGKGETTDKWSPDGIDKEIQKNKKELKDKRIEEAKDREAAEKKDKTLKSSSLPLIDIEAIEEELTKDLWDNNRVLARNALWAIIVANDKIKDYNRAY